VQEGSALVCLVANPLWTVRRPAVVVLFRPCSADPVNTNAYPPVVTARMANLFCSTGTAQLHPRPSPQVGDREHHRQTEVPIATG
jgi:hypothetical protein